MPVKTNSILVLMAVLNMAIGMSLRTALAQDIAVSPGAMQMPLVTAAGLPVPGTAIPLSDDFTPPLISGMHFPSDDPLQFEFIINTGTDNVEGDALKDESQKMIKYFLAALTVPENELWVNLSPYEKDRIISKGLGDTDLGRDMLSQDYILKQLMASLMNPEERLGREFWGRVKSKALALYGTTDVPLDTFNKIWILPKEAVVYVSGQSAFVAESRLQVMLEEDYWALEANHGRDDHGVGKVPAGSGNPLTGVSAEIMKNVLLPEIEREVNEGRNFAPLRQIYNAMILATWYKSKFKESVLGQLYVDKNKIEGIDLEDKRIKDKIYAQYLSAFQKGVNNFIKEEYDEATQSVIPRKYFSGGIKGLEGQDLAMLSTEDIRERVRAMAQRFKYVALRLRVGLLGESNQRQPFPLEYSDNLALNEYFGRISKEGLEARRRSALGVAASVLHKKLNRPSASWFKSENGVEFAVITAKGKDRNKFPLGREFWVPQRRGLPDRWIALARVDKQTALFVRQIWGTNILQFYRAEYNLTVLPPSDDDYEFHPKVTRYTQVGTLRIRGGDTEANEASINQFYEDFIRRQTPSGGNAGGADSAMLDENMIEAPEKPGGIDLNPNNMQMRDYGDDRAFTNFSANTLLSIRSIEGVSPVILDISPLSDLNTLLDKE